MNDKILTQSEKIFTTETVRRPEVANGRESRPNGSSRRHNLIGSNTTIAIGSRVRGQKCEVYVTDMRVRMSAHSYCYPDVIVVSGEPKFEGRELDVLLNPTVVVEIMSQTSLNQDKTEKLDRYLALGSVKEILLVREDEMRVEHYHRQTLNQWVFKIYENREDIISIDSINCKVAVSEIYGQVSF